MSGQTPGAPGWYPDESTGGTRYWDGHRWTGDARPERLPFAAAAAHKGWGIALTILGPLVIVSSPGQFSPQETEPPAPPIVMFALSVLIGFALIGWGVYLLRGRGPTTKSVVARLEPEQVARTAQAQAQAEAQARARAERASTPTIQINVNNAAPHDDATAAQIKAIANPDTAKALQNLQNLLYTRAITDAEYQAAKNKLLGDLQS